MLGAKKDCARWTLAGHQLPTKLLLSLPSSAGWGLGGENKMKKKPQNLVKIKTIHKECYQPLLRGQYTAQHCEDAVGR